MWAGVCGQGRGDQCALRRFGTAAHDKRFGGLGRAGAMKDVVHDGYGCAHIHQHSASGRAGVHDEVLVVVLCINLKKIG